MKAAGLVLALVIVATTAQTAAPDPASSQAPGELREIGRVRASSACANVVVHANSAISGALRNDLMVSQAVKRMRAIDFDDENVINRRNALGDLGKLAADVRAEAVRADGEVKRLRDLAGKSTDETRKTELKSFADALGGALYKQKKIAMDVQGFLEYLSYEDMRDTPELHRMNKITMSTSSNFARPGTPDAYVASGRDMGFQADHGNLNYSQMAKLAAQDFEQRRTQISSDEAKAAEHSGGAVNGC